MKRNKILRKFEGQGCLMDILVTVRRCFSLCCNPFQPEHHLHHQQTKLCQIIISNRYEPAFIDPYNVITGAKTLPLSCQLFQTGSTIANISYGQLVNRFGHTSKLIYNCVFCFVFLNTIFVCTLIKKTWQGNLLACDPPEN